MADKNDNKIKDTDYYLKSGVLSIVGYIFNKSIAFFMIPILTRMMTTVDYGIVNTYTSWLAILSYVIGLALEYSIRTAYSDYKDKYNSYVSSAYSLSLVSFFCIGSVVFILNATVFHQSSSLVCAICIVHAYIHALINYVCIKFTMQEKIAHKVAILLFPNLFSAMISIIFISSMDNNKYMGRIWGYIIVFVPVGICILIGQFIKAPVNYNKKMWKYALTVSVPMVFHGLSGVILSNSDRIIIKHFLGSEVTGIYSLAYNFVQIVLAIIDAIESIWIPWYTNQMEKSKESTVNSIGRIYMLFLSLLVAGLIFVSPEIIVFMSTDDYAQGKEILLPLLLSSYIIFLYSLSVCIEIYYKNTKQIATNTFIAATINILLDWFLVPIYGISAAAYVTLVSYFVSFVLHYRLSHKLNSNLFPFKMYLFPTSIIIIVSAFSIIFKNNALIRWGMGITLGILTLCGFSYLYRQSKMIGGRSIDENTQRN